MLKFKLINHISKQNDNLLDMTVGKAGDLPKWIQAKLNSVVGIDYSVDNIENQLDGACARYLKEKQRKNYIPKVCFWLVILVKILKMEPHSAIKKEIN